MFKVFPLNFKEYPYIDIKIWEWCPASCTDCKFNIDYIPTAKQFSLENILERIEIVDKKFDKKFNLVFWNQDWLNHNDILSILESWIWTWREVRFQMDFHITHEHILLLEAVNKKFGSDKISVKIAQNCRWVDKLMEKTIALLKVLRKRTNFMIYLDLFLDFQENASIVQFFHKHFADKNSDNEYSFQIGNNINLKLHNYSWLLNRKNKCIEGLERKKCQQLDQLYINDNSVFLKDSIDVYNNGDMFIHDNLCNIGDIRISNIYLENSIIYNHFWKFLDHLSTLQLKNSTQSQMCYDCITHGFKYKKI